MFNWKKFRKDNKLTQRQLADLLGCGDSNVSTAEKNFRNLEDYQFDVLFNKYGEAIKQYVIEDAEADDFAFDKQNNDTTTIPLVPLSAMAGKLTGFSLDGITETDCERIISPIKGADFAVPVSGDSMYPLFPNGSRVLVQETNPNAFIEWGKVYVLNTCNGIVVKQLRKSNKEGYVSCYSFNDNSIYAPFDIALADIHGFYKVLMCLSMQ